MLNDTAIIQNVYVEQSIIVTLHTDNEVTYDQKTVNLLQGRKGTARCAPTNEKTCFAA